MSMRTVIAYLSVDNERAFDEADGPIDYVEKKAKSLRKQGIYLDDACIADDDAAYPEERYLRLSHQVCFRPARCMGTRHKPGAADL